MLGVVIVIVGDVVFSFSCVLFNFFGELGNGVCFVFWVSVGYFFDQGLEFFLGQVSEFFWDFNDGFGSIIVFDG